MFLVTGGAYQGKQAFAVSYFKVDAKSIADGKTIGFDEIRNYQCISNFHILIKRLMKAGKSTEEMKKMIDSLEENSIIITDEIGNGIVPAEQFEREWREQTGRLCCYIAAKSQKVIRLSGGIPVFIKDEN